MKTQERKGRGITQSEREEEAMKKAREGSEKFSMGVLSMRVEKATQEVETVKRRVKGIVRED